MFRIVQSRFFMPMLFVLAFTPLMLLIAIQTPPGESPDEGTQLARAGSLLHGQLVGVQRTETSATGQPMTASGVVANIAPVLVAIQFPHITTDFRMTSQVWNQLNAIPWAAHPEFIGAPNTAPYFPVFYLPMSLGLGLGHVLHETPLRAVVLARSFGALAYITVGALALLMARQARLLLFVTLTLPMSLWLGSTCNQDGLMLAATCLAASLLTACGPTHRWPYWCAGVVLACVIAVKPPYAVLALAMLLPLDLRRRGGVGTAIAGLALAVVPMLVWTPLAQAFASGVFIQGPPYTAGPLWPGSPDQVFIAPNAGAQLRVFLHDPFLMLTLPLAALRAEAEWKMYEMVGVLAALRLVMPMLYYRLWFAGLLAAAVLTVVREEPGTSHARWWKAAMMVAAGAVCIMLIYDAQYLSWTTVGNATINGVQGRYFLPLIPLVGVGLAQLRLHLPRPLALAMQVPVLVLALSGTVYLPGLIVSSYFQQ